MKPSMLAIHHRMNSTGTILSSNETEADLRKMDLIDRELRAFAREMELKVTKTDGLA